MQYVYIYIYIIYIYYIYITYIYYIIYILYIRYIIYILYIIYIIFILYIYYIYTYNYIDMHIIWIQSTNISIQYMSKKSPPWCFQSPFWNGVPLPFCSLASGLWHIFLHCHHTNDVLSILHLSRFG